MKHIDKLFKENLYHHEVEVPEGMWEKIAPIAEEESGRAILWFWFAGLLTLAIGGYGIYKMITAETNTDNPGTLAYQHETQPTEILASNMLLTESNSTDTDAALAKALKEVNAEIEKEDHSHVLEANINLPKRNKEKATSKLMTKTAEVATSSEIGNTVESIENTIGVPADMVITKSYINKEGSVIKQSSLADESGSDGPVYDVIMNSETKDFKAGALLRIIEPLEDIPLPAFQKGLKKKTTRTLL